MSRFSSRQRANAALALGVIAVAIAVVGSAGALPGRNSVDSGDVKNNALRSKDLRNGKAVGRGDLVSDQQTRWALVDGTAERIIAQSGGVTIDQNASDGSVGYYILDFGTDLRSRPLIASIAGTSTGVSAAATNCGGPPQGLSCPGGIHDAHHAIVTTHPTFASHDFYVVQLPK